MHTIEYLCLIPQREDRVCTVQWFQVLRASYYVPTCDAYCWWQTSEVSSKKFLVVVLWTTLDLGYIVDVFFMCTVIFWEQWMKYYSVSVRVCSAWPLSPSCPLHRCPKLSQCIIRSIYCRYTYTLSIQWSMQIYSYAYK